jgi:hypothetical protein
MSLPLPVLFAVSHRYINIITALKPFDLSFSTSTKREGRDGGVKKLLLRGFRYVSTDLPVYHVLWKLCWTGDWRSCMFLGSRFFLMIRERRRFEALFMGGGRIEQLEKEKVQLGHWQRRYDRRGVESSIE